MRHAQRRSRQRSRLRRRRIISAGLSVLTVLVALLGAVGFLPINVKTVETAAGAGDLDNRTRTVADRARRSTDPSPTGTPTPAPTVTSPTPVPKTTRPGVMPVPPGSGTGRRVVYAIKTNRVWLVDAKERILRAYPVSGTKYDQLEPGTYDVIRKRRFTTSYHGTERMEYMVTFTFGQNAAIGFHDIPVSIATGKPVQTTAQLGQSLSDGCVRQAAPDAKALWEFAPPGTPVIVLA